ncbi:hypothetical protein DRN63_00805 [Nanoarchaeota archaeon]|nr:MAG: hypothetical protein DRN63_00805 [Nanoarchaeota archaeon]
MVFVDLVLLAFSCISLALGGFLAQESLSRLARHYGFKEFFLGFTVMALSTSLPELIVGLSSALNNISSLSFGDVIGSNVVDLTLVIGSVALAAGKVRIERNLRKNWLFTLFLTSMPLILFLDGELSIIDGIILLLGFGFYMSQLIRERKETKKPLVKLTEQELVSTVFSLVVGIILLILSARWIIRSSILLLQDFNIQPIVIGIVLVSIGTSLPELSFEIQSIRRGKEGLVLGDLFGSLVLNSTLILGLVSVINPIKAGFTPFLTTSLFLILASLVFFFSVEDGKITRAEGFLLLCLYAIFLITSILSGVHLLQYK